MIVTGNPGAGKSELVDRLETQVEGISIIRKDAYIGEVRRRYGNGPWPQLRIHTVELASEEAGRLSASDKIVVVEGVVMDVDEVRLLSSGMGLEYPNPSVALLHLACSEDTTVARRIGIPWDVLGVPVTRRDAEIKEDVVRRHYRDFNPGPIPGEYLLQTDDLTPAEVFRRVIKWLAKTQKTIGSTAAPRTQTSAAQG